MSDDTMAPPTSQPDTEAGGLRDRRSVLRCAAIAALVGASAPVLAACGSGDTPGAAPSTGGSSGPTTAPTTAPSSAPTTGGSASAPTGKVLGAVSDIPVGGGKVFADAKVVVTQPTAGEFKGFSAICTHQLNPVGSVEGGQIICPFHQSHFSITDGAPISGPAQTPLPAVKVAVSGTNVVQTA
ncbi:Rieske (2Fe-2S) protein [Kribbella antibiotica]|uniref:Rieske (2Fe-2S) protein n=1 Tax=Kribbella antibiotica TaxID=190195 RepID=A0A4R4ZJA1_9ACTN|nr:Rieske (2Fe-2S) protein [Kribbella antibiotica]TDD58555.1 Rieske (2Fe-2S) protein [Kribbella antibiotica]